MADFNVPEWITADFLKSCLESNNDHHEGVEVTNHVVEPAVSPGNNYGSVMFRVLVEYKKSNDLSSEHSLFLIIKSPLTGQFAEEFGEFINEVFAREPKYYSEFINETYKICYHSIVPKHYISPDPLCVVLEDLRTSNYEMVNRHKLLDFDHCQFYIKNSSKLHALSIKVHKKNPEIIQSLLTCSPMLYERSVEFFTSLAKTSFQCMVAFLEDKPDYKECMDVINEFTDTELLQRILSDMETAMQPLRALTQKDPWCTNILFKYNEKRQVISAKLIDFQNLNFTSPVKEFVTFVWMSAHPEVRHNRLNDLCLLYCDSLNNHLAELGCDERLSLEDLIADIQVLSPHVLLVVCGLLPPFFADELADFNALTGKTSDVSIKETSRYKLQNSATFNMYYPFIFNEMVREGIFDNIKKKIKQLKSDSNKMSENGIIYSTTSYN